MGAVSSTEVKHSAVSTESNISAKDVAINNAATEKPTCPVTKSESSNWLKAFCPVISKKDESKQESVSQINSQSACPVSHKSSKASEQACPVSHENKGTECPGSQAYVNPSKYNVYSQKIDPTNQMPANANQQPSAEQNIKLSTERVSSSIAKGGTENETWLYPSSQMFWNALVRKNKTEGVTEHDVDTVINIHNNMNENTWLQVLEWEKINPVAGEGREPKLLRFLGRPDELSPKARLKMLFGHPAPFDRHDWVVDRGGQEVRYVIDYYHDESSVSKDQVPKHLKDMHSMQSIKVDVRPAIQSIGSFVDRLFIMPFLQLTNKTSYNPPPFLPSKVMLSAEEVLLQEMNSKWSKIQSTCNTHRQKLLNCQSDEECGAASVAYNLCLANIVCQKEAKAFEACLAGNNNDNQSTKVKEHDKLSNIDNTELAYINVTKCIELFQADSKKVLASKK